MCESVALFQQLGDIGSVALVMLRMGVLAQRKGDSKGYRALLEKAFTGFQQASDADGIASVLLTEAFIAQEPARIIDLLDENIVVSRAAGLDDKMAAILHDKATNCGSMGHSQRRGKHFKRQLRSTGAAVAIRSLPMRLSASLMCSFGRMRLTQRLQQALSMQYFHQIKARYWARTRLAALADVLGSCGRPVQAARLFGAWKTARVESDATQQQPTWPMGAR